MGMRELGCFGEWLESEYLFQNLVPHIQLDWIATDKDGSYYSEEIKYQTPFITYVFGVRSKCVGIPIDQVNSRLEFYRKTGIRSKLVWFDRSSLKPVDLITYQIDRYECWLDVLQSSGKFIDKSFVNCKKKRFFPSYLMNRSQLTFKKESYSKT